MTDEPLGAGPCDHCGSYTASKRGVHRKCEQTERNVYHRRVLAKLCTLIVERAQARARVPVPRGRVERIAARRASGEEVELDENDEEI